MELLRALSEKKCLLEGRIHTQLCNALHKIVYEMPSEVISKSPNASQEEAYNVASSRLDLVEHLLTSILTPLSTYQDTLNSSNAEFNDPPAVVQTEVKRLIKEGSVEENVTVPVVIPNQKTQTVTVSVGVGKEVQTLEGAVAQQVATNVPAAEQQDQLTVELLDRNQQTHQVPIKTVTVTPAGDVKERPAVENTVQQVVPITTVTTRTQTEELEDVHHHSYENATLHPAAPNEQSLDLSTPAAEETEPTANIEQTNVRRSGRVSRKRSPSLSSESEPQPKNTRRSAPAQPIAATRATTTRPSQGAPLVCPECKTLFERNVNLTRHLRTHTGEKPFRCIWTGCAFSTGDRSSVARHVRVMHLKLPATKKEQRELGIVQERHERDYLIMVEQQDN